LRIIGGAGVVLAVVLAIWVLIDEAGRGAWLAAVAAALWGIILAALIIEAFLRPAVSTTGEGVVLVNPFRTVVVPWGAVRDVETELALQIITDQGRHTSWAATGKRSNSALARALWGAGRSHAGDAAPPSGRSAAPSVAELVRSGALARGITGPVECKLFIEEGLSDWRVAMARAPGVETAAGEPDDARIEWHWRWMVSLAMCALLLLAVTLAL
jgi:hypothetical protein